MLRQSKLREKSRDVFAHSHLPDVYLISANRGPARNIQSITFAAPESEIRYRRVSP